MLTFLGRGWRVEGEKRCGGEGGGGEDGGREWWAN
jgi:hypothetical protein